MATFALLGSSILLENKYRPVIAVKEEIPWKNRKLQLNSKYLPSTKLYSSETLTYQNPVVKLHSCWIFKNVFKGWREGEQIVRDPAFSHLWEGVINQPSI